MKTMYIITAKTCKILYYWYNICRFIATRTLKKCWILLSEDAEITMPERIGALYEIVRKNNEILHLLVLTWDFTSS